MLGYVLTDGRAVAWQAFARRAAIRLEPEERAAIAWVALRSLDRETAVATVEAAFEPEQGAGMPIAALDMDDPADEAALWAAHASPDEIIAYAAAILRAMPKRWRRDFVDFAESEAA